MAVVSIYLHSVHNFSFFAPAIYFLFHWAQHRSRYNWNIVYFQRVYIRMLLRVIQIYYHHYNNVLLVVHPKKKTKSPLFTFFHASEWNRTPTKNYHTGYFIQSVCVFFFFFGGEKHNNTRHTHTHKLDLSRCFSMLLVIFNQQHGVIITISQFVFFPRFSFVASFF